MATTAHGRGPASGAMEGELGWEAPILTDEATFLASFPTIMSAIKVYGDRQGMRIQLDIPESEMGAAIQLLAWREQVLEITVRPNDGRQPESTKCNF